MKRKLKQDVQDYVSGIMVGSIVAGMVLMLLEANDIITVHLWKSLQ